MATTSAAILRAFATMRTMRSTPRTARPVRWNRLTANSPRPSPVARAVRSQISWTAAMSGKVIKAVQMKDQTEPCSGLRVRGDSGGVVIGRSGHQSRPHGPQVLAPDRSLGLGVEIEFRLVPGRGSGFYALFSRTRFAPRLNRHSSAPVNLIFKVL
jgi:hypothetical protein